MNLSSGKKFHAAKTQFIKENQANIKDVYKISSSIGVGSYGEVRKCLHKETKAQRAVKIINKNKMNKEETLKLEVEIAILRSMDHPNILSMYEFF